MAERDKPRRSAYDKALAMLARREHSRRELQLRLGRGGHDEEESAAAIERLGAQNYQDERRFAEMIVRSRVAQGYGPHRIRAELRSHAIPAAVIDELLADATIPWDANALALLQRRYRADAEPDFAERARRAQFLLRRGFAAATVSRIAHADVDDAFEP